MRAATVAIQINGIAKRYRLYQKPVYRLLDLFGLCPADRAHYSEHAALDDVSLTIGRGAKVAIIGRNGAGKSTLLKIITGIVRPSAGTVEVHGTVSNLLQIGSGFHPDFTGRQNVFANLAHQGITGREAERIFEEVIEFAEIGEYIDQPMKTYSTGMCSRLMFSSSVVTRPDILIVDEILGVGDAYFSHKSFERMRELCAGAGTTLLLVTHDIYSALNLCDRFVWLDRGRIRFDGPGKAAVGMYESSVKEQEEHRLREQSAARLAPDQGPELVHVLVRTRSGFAVPSPLALDSVQLTLADGESTTLPVAEGAAGWTLLPEGNLGPAEVVAGRRCRVLRTSGSIFHKAEWLVRLPHRDRIASVRVASHYAGSEPIDVRVFTPERVLLVAGTLPAAGEWRVDEFAPTAAERGELDAQRQTDYGTGLVRIVNVEFLDAHERMVYAVRHGDPLTVRVRLKKSPALDDRHITFVVGFARQGSPYSVYIHDAAMELPSADECTVDVQIDSVRLGSGQWYVNVGIGEPNLFEKPAVHYFTLNANWYHLAAGRIEFRVESATKFDAAGCFATHPASIVVTPSAHHQTSMRISPSERDRVTPTGT